MSTDSGKIAGTIDKYFEKLVEMLARIGDVLPRFNAYALLFQTHANVRQALTAVYLDIIEFCTAAKRIFQERRKSRGIFGSPKRFEMV